MTAKKVSKKQPLISKITDAQANVVAKRNVVDGLRKKRSLDPNIAAYIEDANYIRWYLTFEDLISKIPNIQSVIDSNVELAYTQREYMKYAGVSPTMEDMLEASMRKGLELVISNKKRKERAQKDMALARKKKELVISEFIKICEDNNGEPEKYWLQINKALRSEYGKGFTQNYISSIVCDAERSGHFDPKIRAPKKVL